MSYVRFSSLDFVNDEVKNTCYNLLKDIRELQKQILHDEEYASRLAQTIGKNVALAFEQHNDTNRKVLIALKISFWYYTGKSSDHILLDDEYDIDIFDTLGYK